MVRRARTEAGMPAGITPAAMLMLMTGVESGLAPEHPRHDARAWAIKGHRSWLLTGNENLLEDLWAEHGPTLTREGTRAGFRPFWTLEDGDEWTPEEARAERAWRDAFLAVHGRPGDAIELADIVLP